MTDDALGQIWRSSSDGGGPPATAVLEQVLVDEQKDRAKELRSRAMAAVTMTVVLPFLVRGAVLAPDSRVRLAYALMAIGATMMVFSEWVYARWVRRVLPGPVEARVQLRMLEDSLAHQAQHFRTNPLWCSPIFLGTAMIGLWAYGERSRIAAYAIWLATCAAWLRVLWSGLAKSRALEARRREIEEVWRGLA